ncbi:MAG: radical SAM protein [Pontiellaceae bacterium]|nr:radical SAM protein [Pontiellaceae bacterium]MBN2786256.1 radical SAM protein [Pontiellaceae bacterium]
MKILLFTPPLLQPNTPYAATPLLTAWLRSQGHDAVQQDLSLELVLRLFSPAGLAQLADELGLEEGAIDGYLETIEPVMAFLQGRNDGAAEYISMRGWLPEGEHLERAYEQEEQLGWGFRGLDAEGRSRHLASLYLDDIADAASAHDPHFGFSRYAESLSASLPEFDPMREALEETDSLFIDWLNELVDDAMEEHQPEMVAMTVPFPGCLFGALAIARRIRQMAPSVHVTLGGGYVNTELRELSDPGIFKYVDSITLDSGWVPLLRLAEGRDRSEWVRTYALEDGAVKYYNASAPEVSHNALPAPDYTGLPMESYFSIMEVLNPVTSLWSDGRWNKLVLAHGCCWSRCAFCDTSVDYICRYDPAEPDTICDWMESVMHRTGFAGFHFVDEALPPALLEPLCDEILRRGLEIEWWGNVRFEKRFSTGLIRKMAQAGCIAVTGGLETCCDRTLKLMKKGITVESAARVLHDFADAGILTHAYLMYGFPTQTFSETVDALDTVRRLFDQGCLHSAFWHRFALTAHSEISTHADAFGITLSGESGAAVFARNEIPFSAEYGYDLEQVGEGLRRAAYNYQLGVGLELSVADWFGA